MADIKTLQEAEHYLSKNISSKGTYTLDRMHLLMRTLGNPQDTLRIIHVGGTAGKGSVCTLTAAILEHAGYRVGLHTSPHLVSVTERIMINRTPIPEEQFIELLNSIKPVTDRIQPTYYEITVALMFVYFSREHVDAAVIEVGLGGRLDGTNVLTPAVSVINNVGLDHTEILGDTVEKIAADKREIIKPGRPAVSAVTQPSVRALLTEKARSVNAPLYLLDRDYSVRNVTIDKGVTFDYESDKKTIQKLHVSLLGRHQAINAAVAVTAIMHCGLPVPEDAIRGALTSIQIRGRLESTERFIIDGAHNPMKMSALSRALTDYYPGKTFPVLLAVKGDKNVSEMLRILSPHVSCWYITTISRQTDWGSSQMYPTSDLAACLSGIDSGKPITVVPDYQQFLAAYRGPPLLITGSLYLVGAVLEWKMNHPDK